MKFLQALVVKLQQDAYKFPNRIMEFKVQSQGTSNDQSSSPSSHAAQAPAMPGSAASAQQMPGLPHHHGVSEPSSHEALLMNPLHHHHPLNEALEDVLQSAGQHQPGEPWLFPSFGGGGGGFDVARDPFDVQFSGSQPCGLLLSSTGARL